MIIYNLELHNFRQFAGTQLISFSTDPTRKATILIAESGFGKTTLLQSFLWALYGKCKYSNVLNSTISSNMRPESKESVCVKVVLCHGNHVYEIIREQTFWKKQTRVESDDTTLTINEKMSDGTTSQTRGRDAQKIIRSIMHPDLSPYFFLEAEKAESIGEQMSKGKTGSNSEFVAAIKGLLGFTHLYEAKKHLKGVIKTYQNEIARSTTDLQLRRNIEQIQKIEQDNEQCRQRIEAIKSNIQYYTEKRNELSDQLQKFEGVAEKQRRTKVLSQELEALAIKINQQKAYILKRFSSQIPYLAMQRLVLPSKEVLANADALDKGIPGINAEAVRYMLDNHKCICGEELKEGSDHWKMLQDWITYLPPNNIGYEIDTFNGIIATIKNGAQSYLEEYRKARQDLNDYIRQQHKKVSELEELNADIGSVNVNVAVLKEQELSYSRQITELSTELGRKQELISNNEKEKRELLAKQEYLKQQDAKTSKIQLYLHHAETLAYKIDDYIERREKEKRAALEEAINQIFRVFYKGVVRFKLDGNYNVSITGFDNETYEDFTSGGQDVAVALAFIGAIVKLKIDAANEQNEDEEFKEVYPLVMDAPTSRFGEAQVKSFSELMPSLTDQVIIFVNDVYGPKLLENMSEYIGEQWTIDHHDEFHDTLRRVK